MYTLSLQLNQKIRGFLKAWKELREDPEFQEKLAQVKLKIESEEKNPEQIKRKRENEDG